MLKMQHYDIVFIQCIQFQVYPRMPAAAEAGVWPYGKIPVEHLKSLHGASLNCLSPGRLE